MNERIKNNERKKAIIRKRKIIIVSSLTVVFVMGYLCGMYFPVGQKTMAEDVQLAENGSSAGSTSTNATAENLITTGEDVNGTEESQQETGSQYIDNTADDWMETEIPDIVVKTPIDYSIKSALRQLETLEAEDERYTAILENAKANPEKYPEKLLINLANNPEMISFVADYEGITTDASNVKLSEEEVNSKCPLFLQWDKRWGSLAYGDESNIAISGCGPTTLSMVVVGLTDNQEATPAAIADFAMNNGFYMYGTGTMWDLMIEGAAHYGVTSEQIDISQLQIKETLDEGGLIVCSVRAGDFTTGGHFIVIYDYDEEGFSINDPFCVYKSSQKWTYNRLHSQIKAVWSFTV